LAARARFAPFLISQHAGVDDVGQAPLSARMAIIEGMPPALRVS
jgi:hypothetical protein